MDHLALATTAVLSCAVASAQRTWYVDARGAGDFLDLPPAVAAAAPGDTIVARYAPSGGYSTPTIDKGITLLQGHQGGNWTHLIVTRVPAGQTVAIHGWGSFASADLFVTDCEGDVHLNRVSFGVENPFDGSIQGTVRITNCRNVTVNNAFMIDTHVTNSSVLLTQAFMLGMRSIGATTAGPALTAIDSDVRMVDCTVTVDPSSPNPGGPTAPLVPALSMQGGRLRVAGSSGYIRGGVVCCNSAGQYLPSPGIESNGGEVILDPDVTVYTFGAWPAVVGSSTLRYEEMPYLRVPNVPIAGSSVNETLKAWLYAPPGASAFLCASLPSRPFDTPFGEFWLDPTPGMLMVISSGTVDPTGLFFTYSYLYRQMPTGMVTVWQGVVVDASGIRLSTPAIPIVGYY